MPGAASDGCRAQGRAANGDKANVCDRVEQFELLARQPAELKESEVALAPLAGANLLPEWRAVGRAEADESSQGCPRAPGSCALRQEASRPRLGHEAHDTEEKARVEGSCCTGGAVGAAKRKD